MPESTKDLFPERLRAARALRELNQDALATRTKLQPSAISHFETGTRKPSFDNLKRLADALDVTTDYLLGRVEDPHGVAAADQLYRDIEKLSSADREIAELFIESLKQRKQKDGE